MEVPRRRVNTYGKATKKILVHDLFNVSSKQSSLYEPIHPPTIDNFTRTRTGTPMSELSEDPETSQQLKDELQASFDISRDYSAAPSRTARSQTPSDIPSPAVFDLASSEDEMLPARRPAKVYKRRKVAERPAAVISNNSRRHDSPAPRASQDEGKPVLERKKGAENKTLGRSPATMNTRQDPHQIPRSKLSPAPITKPPRSPLRIGFAGFREVQRLNGVLTQHPQAETRHY